MPGYNTYVGARYVPIFDGDWDNTKKYDPLTIVMYQGDSYTSKTYVPVGANISNKTFWAKTGNYNAQVAQLANEVEGIKANRYYVTPEMFGAKGDGYSIDNVAVNNCLKFATDNGLDVVGLGVYCIDNSTPTWGYYYGCKLEAPNVSNITLYKMHFKLKENPPSFSSILTCMYGKYDIRFEECIFEMAGDYPGNTGGGDGGNTAVYMVGDSAGFNAVSWYKNVGNVFFDKCKFLSIWSYCIHPQPFLGTLKVTDCYFESECCAVLTWAQNSFIENCKYKKLYDSTGKSKMFCIDEIEVMTDDTNLNYPKSVYISHCETNAGLFIIQQNTQPKIRYSTVDIRDCTSGDADVGSGDKYFIAVVSDNTRTECTIDKITIENCDTKYDMTFDNYTAAFVCENSKFRKFFGRLTTGVFNNCYIGAINGAFDDKLIVSGCVFKAYDFDHGCISTTGPYSGYGSTDDGIKVLTISDTVIEQPAEGAIYTLVKECRYKKCYLSNIENTNERSLRLVNNYFIRNDEVDRYVFASPIVSQYEQTDAIFTGVKYGVIQGIGPANAFRCFDTTGEVKIVRTWFDT